MSFRTFFQSRFFTTRKNNAFNVQINYYLKLFTTCFSRTKDVRKNILLRHNMQKTSIYLSRKIISFHFICCRCARHDDKFVTRLSLVTRIVWFTKLDDNNTAFISLSNSFSYIRRDSSRKIWTECDAIDQDVWRMRLADA